MVFLKTTGETFKEKSHFLWSRIKFSKQQFIRLTTIFNG